MNEDPLVLQTWTVRHPLRIDAVETLRTIRAMGFQYLELAGNAGRSPTEFAKLCRDCDLKVVGIHQPPLSSGRLENLIDEATENCAVHKCSFATVMFDPEHRRDEESYYKYAELSWKAGEELRRRGITLCYHCYNYDLTPLVASREGQSGVDILLERTSPEHLAFQLDTHFLYRTGLSPAELVRKCASRCKLVHVNDLATDGENAVLGNGTIPWRDLMTLIREETSAEWFILEHTSRDPLAWISGSLEFWRRQSVTA